MTFTIVYDNHPGRSDLTPAWGFACAVHGLETTILFDTGGDGQILVANMRALGIEPGRIDGVVISHVHGDHTGGLEAVLALNPRAAVYIPTGFAASAKGQIRSRGGRLIEADASFEICPGAKTTGTLGKGAIEEQGLCVRTGFGWVLVTGCAHPGVADMASRATRVTGGPVALVLGGYHMTGYGEREIDDVIDRFEQLGVKGVAPCHCTGEMARAKFKERYADQCRLVGIGSILSLDLASPQAKTDAE